jgi:hypothetical protein
MGRQCDHPADGSPLDYRREQRGTDTTLVAHARHKDQLSAGWGGRLMRVIEVGCFCLLKVETFHAYYLCEYFDQTNSSLFGERLA